MKFVNQSQKGFTLVEIMIVVVIIGLLAAMAIPAFQKVRRSSIAKTMLNDARQIGAAAQQYMMENGVTTAPITYTSTSGAVGGPLSEWVKVISKGYTGTSLNAAINSANSYAFTLQLPAAFGNVAQYFDAEGKRQTTTAE